jgi:hypothetical protein
MPRPFLQHPASAPAQNANTSVVAFINGDRNEDLLQNANNYVDSLLIEFRWLAPFTGRRESRVILKAAEHLAKTVDDFEARARANLDALTQEIAAARSETASNFQNSNAVLESIRTSAEASVTSLTTKIDASIAAFTGEIAAQKSRLDTYFEQQLATHVATEQERQRDFSAVIETVRQSARTETDAEVANVRTAAAQFQQEGDQLMASLRGLEQQAKEITGVTAAAAVIGSYITEADEQRQEADTWRKWASALLVLVVVGAIVTTLWSPLRNGVTTGQILEYGLTRVPIVLVLGGVFTYAAQQSNAHRVRERRARRRAMELTAFRPFIGELSREDQHELIKETTRKYFRGEDENDPVLDDVQNPASPAGR